MSRRKLIAGNWKMNLTVPAGLSLAQAIVETSVRRPEVEVVLCPSYTSLHGVAVLLARSNVRLGAQDVFWKDQGAYTGQISPGMLLDAGCSYCIVGHSERRGRFGGEQVEPVLLPYFSDTNKTVGLKLQALVFANIAPILCVGETAEERKEQKTEHVIAEQLQVAIDGLAPEECSGLAVAYEPVWAIGTGHVCDAAEAARVCGFIRNQLAKFSSDECADQARVLYGGSVKADNCAELFKQKEIDGALVGGASLNAEEFSRIILAA